MRTISADTSALLTAGFVSEHVRVQVKDSGGTFRDLTTYPGVNLVDSVTWREDIDSPHRTADIELKREVENLSLAPLMQASALNRGFNPAASYAALLALNREIKIDVAVVPMDKSPASGDWFTVFHGYVDSIDPASSASVQVGARDLGAAVQDTFIETERVYSYGSGGVGTSMRVWEPGTAYALNEYVLPASRGTNDPGTGKFYKCTTAGTSGSAEPNWPGAGTIGDGGVLVWTYQGTTSTGGTAVETVMQQILNDNSLSGVTLSVPTSPSWNIRQFIQRREPVLEALRNLAQQIGWEVRYVWVAASSAFLLRFYEPDRAKVAVDRTFSRSDWEDLSRLAVDISAIRNAVRVIYSDRADLWPNGEAKRKTIEVTDATSITAYGRRFAEVAEDENSQIDSSTEATDLANAVLADLKDPQAEVEMSLVRGFPWVELGDLYTLTADGRHFSADQTLAVYGYEHTAKAGAIKTTIQLRDKPAGQYLGWLAKLAHPAANPNHELTLFGAAAGVTPAATATLAGVRILNATTPEKNAHREEYEYHLSTSSGFTPDSTTLKECSAGRASELTDLAPGTVYYAKVVPRARNAERVIRGQPSAQVSFTAGYVEPRHINPETVPGLAPPNGSFEGRLAADQPPEHWGVVTGVWVTDLDWLSTDRIDGLYSVHLKNTSVAAKLRSAYFPVRTTELYTLEAWIKKVGTPDAVFALAIEWYDSAKSSVSTSTLTKNLNTLGAGWERVWTEVTAPASAVYGRVFVAKNTADAFAFYADSVRLLTRPEAYIGPSLGNSWVDYGGSYAVAGYSKTADGLVILKGTIKSGTLGLAAFTLPTGYRPSEDLVFAAPSNGAFGELQVQSDGDVIPVSGSNASFSITCAFRAV